MIAKKDFENMRKELDDLDNQREVLIKKSRDIVKLSKKVIYSVHRNEIKQAGDFVKQIKSSVAELDKTAKKTPMLYYSGPFKIAIQEFVEAACYYEFVKNKKVPSAKELKADTEYYLLGLCDLTGELVRKAINSAINNDYDKALFIKKFVNDIYNELMLFEFRNELRKKFDSIKYDLKKLDDLALGIKLKK